MDTSPGDSGKFYITTPIYYVTADPHVGTSYTTIVADALARYRRLQGREVLFATGVDEHAQKVLRAAQAQGVSVMQFVDGFAEKYKQAWGALHIELDRFIRTTEPVHRAAVQDVVQKLVQTGDIYKAAYEGWYCVPCETYLPEGDLVDGNCPDCGRPVESLEQEAYFFRTSKYADALLEHIEDNPEFIQPDSRRNEVIGFIKTGLRDSCISRAGTDWGIPVPGDEQNVVYVWFDALINYLTVAGYPDLDPAVWPPDAQVMGKDILPRFHATIWPAMLMALDIPLPKALFAHGWWVCADGSKISKSKGNIVDLQQVTDELVQISGCTREVAVDAIRCFLMREVQFGLDGSFSMDALLGRFNADLANDLGNILNRTLPLVGRYLDGLVPTPGPGSGAFAGAVEEALEQIDYAMAHLDLRGALEAVWRLLAAGNKFIDQRAPWELHKEGKAEELAAVLYDTVDLIRVVATLLSPFMPRVSVEIWRQLGLEQQAGLMSWEHCRVGLFPAGTRICRGDPIFPRVDLKKLKAQAQKPAVTPEQAKPASKSNKRSKELSGITYEQFSQIDLRVGRVIDVEPVPDADKLLKLTVDIGEEQPRTVVAGLAETFSPRELLDANVVVVANLEPATIRGVQSDGMILAAGEKVPVALVTLDRDCDLGSNVR